MSKISDPPPLDLGHSPQFFLSFVFERQKGKIEKFKKVGIHGQMHQIR